MNAPVCRVCGRPLAANRRGDYVDCCSRFIRDPLPRREGRATLHWWLAFVERLTLGTGSYFTHVTPGGRAMLFALGVTLVALAVGVALRVL